MPTTTALRFTAKNIHESAAASDGVRVLVERHWPRDLAREDAHIDLWLADAAPSLGLRRQFGTGTVGCEEFRRSYQAELSANPPLVRQLRQLSRERPVTLLYSDADGACNHAAALAEYLGG
jgi:uncharacterized protein YeaO (DUF488 family)